MRRRYPSGQSFVDVLKGVNLRLMGGEFVALVGPSGCGKSTLMNILGCLDRPTSGRVFLDGQDISNFDDDQLAEVRNRKIGFIFQHYNLLARMPAQRNVELPMAYARIPPKERQERARQGLEEVGLGHRFDHTPAMLSGGECQRVAVARALALRPKLLLADEPTGNLDSKTGAEIMALFHRLNQQGHTILMVTHSREMAEQGSRIVTMKDGVFLS